MTIPSLPSLQALRILEAATRLRSYSAAAKELGLTHGAVSRQMQALERWAGEALFERRGPHMEPTESGLALATRTRVGMRVLGDAFAAPYHSETGGLTVSATPAFARLWLIPRLPRLHAEHPGLIKAIEAEMTFFESSDRKVDVAIRSGKGGWPDVQYERICAEEAVPVSAPAVAETIRSAEDLLNAPLIETPLHPWRIWFDAVGLTGATDYRPSLSVSDANLALEAAINGLGVALIRSRLLRQELAPDRLVRVHPISAPEVYEYYVVWRTNSRQRKKVDLLRKWLHREMAADHD